MGALSHLLVLDMSRVLAGPWATQFLADLGAEVIKIERPGAGDDTRAWGPPFLTAPDGGRGDAAYYVSANRNKKSVAVDIAKPEGAALVRKLAARADVLVENFRTGGLAAYGLDYASVRAANPRLVYCSITGFGQTGPYAERAGYDFVVQGMGGLMSVTGQPDGAPGAEPMKAGVALADVMTGLYAAGGILAALIHAQRTGQGQHIDAALLDVQVAALANQAANYLVSGRAPGRLGNAHPNIVPYQAFPTADGHVILAIANDGQFAKFCRVAGREDLLADPRFAAGPERVIHRASVVPAVAQIVRARTTADWIAALEPEGVPCGAINAIDHVFADPQVLARGMVQTAPGGGVRLVPHPLKYSETPATIRSAPPRLGADTGAVLRDVLGLDAAALADLRAAGAI